MWTFKNYFGKIPLSFHGFNHDKLFLKPQEIIK